MWWVAINSGPHRIWVGFQFTSRLQRKRKQLVARTLKKKCKREQTVSYSKCTVHLRVVLKGTLQSQHESLHSHRMYILLHSLWYLRFHVCLFFSEGCLIWSRLISDCYTLQIRPHEFIVHLICKIQFQLKWCGISSERRLQTHNADNVNKIWSVATDCNLNKILFTFTRCRGQSTLGNQESWVLVTLLFV